MYDCFLQEQVSQNHSLFGLLCQPEVSNGLIFFPLSDGLQDSQVNIRDTDISLISPSDPTPTIKLTQKRKIKKDHTRVASKKLNKSNEKGSDYKKNICGYVTKKIMRELVNEPYQYKVRELCEAQGVDLDSVKNFYSPKIERVTGPSHIPPLLTPTSKEEVPIMKVFYNFFLWFLFQRYLRHLFIQGKMELKRAYIEYKNRELLPMLEELKKNLEGLPASNSHQNTQIEITLSEL